LRSETPVLPTANVAFGAPAPSRFPIGWLAPGDRTVAQISIVLIGVLTILRFALAAYLPLSFDESYFWLWSRHLAISYYDHPPLIALAIRAGTFLFGDNPFGVRFIPLVLSIAASGAMWRSGAILIGGNVGGALACGLLNATLMMTAESLGATPDALVLCAAAVLIWTMAELEQTKDSRWWIAAGLAVGLALFAKYTAFFLCISVALWLVVTTQGRQWLKTVWPYAGAAVALAFLVSTIAWNMAHNWISFRFQFGRVVEGHFTARYLIEFLAGQIALASPFILLLGLAGLYRETFGNRFRGKLAFCVLLIWPPLAYFAFHALHERVQGNWPSFLYPSLALLAASVFYADRAHWPQSRVLRYSAVLALPVGIAILLAVYIQTVFDVVPMGYADPIARMTAVGIEPVMQQISDIAHKNGAKGIATTKYVVTGWLSFYLRPHMPIVQLNEDYRWLSSPHATREELDGPLLYITQNPRQEWGDVARHYSRIVRIASLNRMRRGAVIDSVNVYILSGFHGPLVGRTP